jgi:hypothetical protein
MEKNMPSDPLSRCPPRASGANGNTVGSPVWNKPGHGVLAFVAESVLRSKQPDALKKIHQVLSDDPRGRSSIALSARWPDDMRSDKDFIAMTGPWHFVDILWPEGTEPDPQVQLPEGPHAASKLAEIATDLRTQTDPQQRADDLAFVLHLAGDLHQPLHCVTRVNDEHPAPEGDRGGNGFHLKGKVKNLHSLWDGLIVVGDNTSEQELKNLAAEIAGELPESSFSSDELENDDPEAWAREGYALAVTAAYRGIEEGAAPGDDYLDAARQLARRRAALGGYRLARMLVAITAEW